MTGWRSLTGTSSGLVVRPSVSSFDLRVQSFRHIVCVLCYPEFVGTRQAPHDAVCICGKRVRAGDAPGPSTAPQCILCNEMLGGHFAVAHSGQDA